MTEYAPTVILLFFFTFSSHITYTILYNELLHLKTDNRQHQFRLMAYSETAYQTFYTRVIVLSSRPKYWEMFSHYYIYMCISEHVCMEMFPRYWTSLMHARTQSPEASENKGVEGVECLAGACSVSLCLFHFIEFMCLKAEQFCPSTNKDKYTFKLQHAWLSLVQESLQTSRCNCSTQSFSQLPSLMHNGKSFCVTINYKHGS